MRQSNRLVLGAALLLALLSCSQDAGTGPSTSNPPAGGSIFVNSIPSGAAITLDSRATGKTTPDTLKDVPTGAHTIALSLPSFADSTVTVTVSAGQVAGVLLALRSIVGSVFVASAPSGAAIALDGAATGKVTPDTLRNLAAGSHAITLSLGGFADSAVAVTVTAGGVASVSVALRSLASQYAGTWMGTTSQNLPVFFRVNSQGVVDSLTARLRLNFPTFTCTGTFPATPPIAINAARVDAVVGLPAVTNIGTTLHGTFSSATSVSGTYDGFSGSFFITCGSTFSVGTGSPLAAGTWQATRQGEATVALGRVVEPAWSVTWR